MKNDITQAAKWLCDAEAILITASNGLSISEGYHIFADNNDFKKYFGDFRERYGINCLIQGIFAPLSKDEHESYMKQVHQYLIDDYKPSAVMKNLLSIVKEKDYFVLTSNADTHFQLCGFDADKIFEIEGNVDGLEMRSERWNEQKNRFDTFTSNYAKKNLVVFELGIGRTNRLIKKPVMEMVECIPDWKYITLNMPHELFIPQGAEERTLKIAGDIVTSFCEIIKEMS